MVLIYVLYIKKVIIIPKFCDKCGGELKNQNAKFCDKCGAEITINKNKTDNDANIMGGTVICPACGQTSPIGHSACVNCGSPFENNNFAIIIGYVVTCALGIFGLIPGIYLFTRKNAKSKIQGINIVIFSILITLLRFIFQLPWKNFSPVILIVIIVFIVIGAVLWNKE